MNNYHEKLHKTHNNRNTYLPTRLQKVQVTIESIQENDSLALNLKCAQPGPSAES